MIFQAKTSRTEIRIREQVKKYKISKIYNEVVEGKAETKSTIVEFIEKEKNKNNTTINKNGKESILEYELINYINDISLIKIKLKTGRSHQIRVQFSSRNHPLLGDMKYNKKAKKGNIALFAKELSFYHPITNEYLEFKLPLPNRQPFNLF